MIDISIKKQDKIIQEISIKGHSMFADKGKDIVCAGVSAIAIGTISAISEIIGVLLPHKADEGDYWVKFTDDDKTQIIAETMLYQLMTIENSYKKYVKIHFI